METFVIEQYYIHNIFTIILQQILDGKLLVILMVTQIRTINNLSLKICYEITVDEALLHQILSFLNLFIKIYFFLNKYNNFYIA